MVQQLHDGHQIHLLREGVEFFPALVTAINAAQHEVRLETYIFHFDESGKAVATALENAALRGVQVYLVVDGIGTPPLPISWQQRFAAAGVQWKPFSPLGIRRLHRKLCVIDRRFLFCGGINIIDDHVDVGGDVQNVPRLDFAVQMTGAVVAAAHETMAQLWTRKRATLHFNIPKPNAELVLRDNFLNRNRIERAYRKAIATARDEVVIANAYFLPAAKLRRALIHAAQRGVRVHLLLQGRYENFLQYHGARPVYGALLRAGVQIHEYHAGFLHAKVAVVDGHWATVGSSNLDPLSLLLAREANVVVEDIRFAQELRSHLMETIQTHCHTLQLADDAARSICLRVQDSIAFGVVRLLIFLTGKRY